MKYMQVNYNIYNYFTVKREKMDSFIVIVIYECITKSMIERILGLFKYLIFEIIMGVCYIFSMLLLIKPGAH